MADKPIKKTVEGMPGDGNNLSDARQALAEQLNKLLGEKASDNVKSTGARPKVVRDSFTMPENDYALIAQLQDRAMDFRMHITKGELLRAGLRALNRMSDEELLNLLQSIEKLKPGRQKDS